MSSNIFSTHILCMYTVLCTDWILYFVKVWGDILGFFKQLQVMKNSGFGKNLRLARLRRLFLGLFQLNLDKLLYKTPGLRVKSRFPGVSTWPNMCRFRIPGHRKVSIKGYDQEVHHTCVAAQAQTQTLDRF